MKKRIALVLLLLLPLMTFSYAGSVVECEGLNPESGDYIVTYARKFANMLEEELNVTIMLGDECNALIQAVPPRLIGYDPELEEYNDLTENLVNILAVGTLKEYLRKLPTEFYTYIRDEQAPHGLRFLLVDHVYQPNPFHECAGLTFPQDGYYNIILKRCNLYANPYIIFHEIWHAIEYNILASHPDAFMIWDALNPPGFHYSDDYLNVDWNDYPADYFASGYGMVNGMEDRATIAEAVFYDNSIEWFSERPGVVRKAMAMNLAMCDTVHLAFNFVPSGADQQ